MSNDIEREAFEKWAMNKAKECDYQYMDLVLERMSDGNYATSWVDSAWMGWQGRAQQADAGAVLEGNDVVYQLQSKISGGWGDVTEDEFNRADASYAFRINYPHPTAPAVEGGGVPVAYAAVNGANSEAVAGLFQTEELAELGAQRVGGDVRPLVFGDTHNGEQAPEQRCTNQDCGRFFDENAKRWQCKARRDDACALDHPVHNGEQGGEAEPKAWLSPALYGSKLTFQKPEPPEGWEDYADDWYCYPLYTRPPKAQGVPEEYRQALQDAYDIILADANTAENYGSLWRIRHVLGQIQATPNPPTEREDGHE